MSKHDLAAVHGLILLLSLSLPTLAAAGEIYGRISFDGAAVGAGTAVAASCAGKAYPAVQTDKAGNYHLVVAETGKCTLTITYKGEAASMGVASYEDAAQADVVLEKKDGKLAARRR